MTRITYLICDICKNKQDYDVVKHGVDWLTPGFMPSFSNYLRLPITEICGNCAKKIANYIESIRIE